LTASEAAATLAGIMTTRARFVFATLLAVLATAVAAPATRAVAAEGGREAPPMGRVAVRRGVQSPEGLFTVRLNLLVSASKGSFGKPTSIAPDLYYGVSDAHRPHHDLRLQPAPLATRRSDAGAMTLVSAVDGSTTIESFGPSSPLPS
jgi:hypothetical protein